MSHTAYLLVILDKNGNRKRVGTFSERHPTMLFEETACLVMERSASSYVEARLAIIAALISMGEHRAWLLRELGVETP